MLAPPPGSQEREVSNGNSNSMTTPHRVGQADLMDDTFERDEEANMSQGMGLGTRLMQSPEQQSMLASRIQEEENMQRVANANSLYSQSNNRRNEDLGDTFGLSEEARDDLDDLPLCFYPVDNSAKIVDPHIPALRNRIVTKIRQVWTRDQARSNHQ